MFRYHANLLIGDREYWREILKVELEAHLNLGNLNSSPDVWWQSYDSFGLKDAHALIEREARHGFGEQGRFFVLEISSITPEAQNALLKTFEEPATDAHFFIIARSAEIFLPTLKSRLVIFGQNEVGSEATEIGSGYARSNLGSANHFLNLDLPERLDFIQKEFLKSKDSSKSDIIDFVTELEKSFRAEIKMNKITEEERFALQEIIKCQRYLQSPRSSNRLVLEHLALTLPL